MPTFRFDLNDEYSKKLENAAAEKRMSIQEYIRYKLFSETTIFSVDEVIKRIQAGDFDGKEFTVPDVFTEEEWSQIDRGNAGVLGKNFYIHITENPELGISFVKDKTIKRRAVYTYKHYENTVMKNDPVYQPIIKKIASWIKYEENKPKSEYKNDAENHDKYRATHDLDCILREGDLRADTIFSLWRPLRFALVRVSGYNKIKEVTGMDLEQCLSFWNALIHNGNLKKLLPIKNETTRLLSELFYLGQKIENTMLLPERWMQSRGSAPFHDYMPYFLYECFEGGNFYKAFGSDEKVCEWIKEEKLDCFFDGAVCKENIIDLAGTRDVKNGVPDDLNYMLRSYISILQKRAN
ncbi:MAG: DUF1413 domain-containing protein [Lachnospiraceae bacterium]|nr:DUF1413 domain-containing protein [Lachnospiraceae bacterium]